MKWLFRIFRTVTAPVIKILSLIFMPVFGNFAAPYKAKDEKNLRLNMAVLSDIHLRGDKDRIRKLHNGLIDLEKSKTPNDVMVSVGDLTDHGEPEHWELAEKIFAEHKPAKELFLVLGNHDTWTREESAKNSEELFIEYNKKISGREIDGMYFSTVINGYTFIALGSEGDSCNADFSDEQVKWLDETMEKAAENGKPIFVFCHQSINVTHGLPYTWSRKYDDGDVLKPDDGGIGEKSDEILAILKKHKNVFYMSGHIHLGLGGKRSFAKKGYASVENDGSLHKINLPCFMFLNHHGCLNSTGLGFQFEVYDDKVIMRPRSYASRIWYSKFNRVFTLER